MPRAEDIGPAARLTACRDAEDYFALLQVPYDPQVLAVNRLHILRLFAPALREYLVGPTSDGEERLRAALVTAHDVFTVSTALDHRLFTVLKDRAPRGFVPLETVTVDHVNLDHLTVDSASAAVTR